MCTLTTKKLGVNILGEVIWAEFYRFGRDKFWAGTKYIGYSGLNFTKSDKILKIDIPL